MIMESAYITGGVRGIGFAIARSLLTCGTKKIALVDILDGAETVKKLQCQFKNACIKYIPCDVSIPEKLKCAFKQAINEFEYIDLMVNNAGLLKDKTWEKEIQVNINHVVSNSLMAIEHMGCRNGGKGGVVLNVASILSLQPFAGAPVYTGTKHFVRGFSQSMGTQFFYDLYGIRFMAMCPGVTETTMIVEGREYVLENIPGLDKLIVEGLGSLPPQKIETCGDCVIEMINKGRNGSVWVVEGGEFYPIKIPARQTFRDNYCC